MNKHFFILICLPLAFMTLSAQGITFDINNQCHTTVESHGKAGRYSIDYKIYKNGVKIIDKAIQSDSQKKINLINEDYNLDGNNDFSIWHMDEGMSTYKVYRIFIFNEKINDFIEIDPSCGDGFINISLDKSHRKLINEYFNRGVLAQCVIFLR